MTASDESQSSEVIGPETPDAGSAEGPSATESGSRRWNLGKDRKKKIAVKAPAPAPSTARSLPKPVAGGGARLAIPRARPETDEEETSHSSIIIPGRPVPAPKTAREWLNHPLTIVICALVICLSLIIGAFSGFGGSRSSGRNTTTMATGETGRAVINIVSGGRRDASGKVIAESSLGEGVETDARFILSNGEMLIATANYMDESRTASPQNFFFVSNALMSAKMPPGDSLEYSLARFQREEAAQELSDMGQKMIETARARGIDSDTLRRVGTRLVAEGLSLLDSNISDAESRSVLNEMLRKSGFPGIDGAAARPESTSAPVTNEQIRSLATETLPDWYSQKLMEVYTKYHP